MKAVFFDAAGTLIGLRDPVGATYSRIAGLHGLNIDASNLDRAFRTAWKNLPQPQHDGKPAADDERSWWHELVRRCFAGALETEPSPSKLDSIFANLYTHYASAEAWIVFPDVVPALTTLRDRCRLFVLSNFDKRLRHILDGHDLTHFFESLVISSEIGASKPDSRIFRAAAEIADATPSECVHIGDDRHLDLEGAKLAGFHARLVRRPGSDLNAITRELMEGMVL